MSSPIHPPRSLRRRVMKRDRYTCQRCGLRGYEQRHVSRNGSVSYTFPTTTPGIHLSIDHRKPKSKGGSHHGRNLQVLCVPCNRLKGVA